MKKITTILAAALLFATITQATIRTVSNFPSNVAQFNTLQAAVNASAAGDTILVHGSPTDYAGCILDKKLTILGPGFSPNKQLPFTASVGRIDLNDGSANTEIQGLVSAGAIFVNHPNVINIRIIRNKFYLSGFVCYVGGSGFVFEGNYFHSSVIAFFSYNGGTYSNIVIQNNLFMDRVVSYMFDGFGSNCTNVLFDHNIINGNGGSLTFRGPSSFLTFTNNIFVNTNPGYVSSSTFNNNITFNCSNNNIWNVSGNVNSGGNVENQDPQMVAQAIVNAGIDNPIADFTIAAGPANNAASDGKDMGLLFDVTGSLNWTNSRMASLPYINTMNITTPTVAPGGNVEVNVQAKISN